MRYTVEDIIVEKNDRLLSLGGHYRGIPERKDDMRDLDRAMHLLSRKCHFRDPKVTFSIAESVGLYRLDDTSVFGRRILRPISGIINGSLLEGPSHSPAVWSIQLFEDRFPNWRTDDDGTPTVLVYYGSNRVLLHKPPTATVVSEGSNYVDAIYIPGVFLLDGSYYAQGFGFTVTASSGDSSSSGQMLYPVADVENTGWARSSGSSDYPLIDDIGDDTNYVQFTWTGADNNVRVGLPGSVSDPGVSTGYSLVYRARVSTIGPFVEEHNLAVSLVQGASTNIGTWTTDISLYGDVWTTIRHDLSATEADAITDHNNLDVDISLISADIGRTIQVSGVRLEVPGSVTSTTPGYSETEDTDIESILGGYPDLPEDAHLAFAVLSAIYASEPGITDQSALIAAQKLEPGAIKKLDEIAHENRYANAIPRQGTQRRFGRSIRLL